ncbi:hypothetical protein PG993_001878 [Apiospora rasikravindrae]|uniref:Aminoglycoside phosphotransferase domain-containing protein n=1 Tax=Apiospora rasikravindrae TaxID=990691 RepID=A0ABR1UCQ0_9PEZI
MTTNPRDSGVSLSSFFTRCHLPIDARERCDDFVTARFPGLGTGPAPFQGYCSYTLFVGDAAIVQFRPVEHSIDVEIVREACAVFGTLVPEVKLLGIMPDNNNKLRVYYMRRLTGLSLTDFRESLRRQTEAAKAHRRQTVRDFAQFHSQAWRHARTRGQVGSKGRVGSSLRWRLGMMATSLPERFQRLVNRLMPALPDIEGLPWTLSHGDFLPSNIMVDPWTGQMSGLLDWAEAEWLPFGVGMYGLEELLGEVQQGQFTYYPEADKLASLFWKELQSQIHELRGNPRQLRAVREAQLFGVLLWHAIAFDDGRLNRVVEEGTDDGEIQRLDAFLLKYKPVPKAGISRFALSSFLSSILLSRG